MKRYWRNNPQASDCLPSNQMTEKPSKDWTTNVYQSLSIQVKNHMNLKKLTKVEKDWTGIQIKHLFFCTARYLNLLLRHVWVCVCLLQRNAFFFCLGMNISFLIAVGNIKSYFLINVNLFWVRWRILFLPKQLNREKWPDYVVLKNIAMWTASVI